LAIWLYFRFTTSLRDVEEMLAERAMALSKGLHRLAMSWCVG
jgi:transposase-like protein